MTGRSRGAPGRGAAIHERVGMKRETAMDHRHLGIVCRRLGESDEAIEHHRKALELAVEVGLPWTVMLAARSMARVLVGTDSEMAARLLGNTEALSELFGYLPDPRRARARRRASLAAATADIGDKAVEAAMAEGAAALLHRPPHPLRLDLFGDA